MELFAVEIRTAQWEPMLLWYTAALQMDSRLRSQEDGYALLTGDGWRISLLQLQDEEPRDRSASSLAIEVEDLPTVQHHVSKYLT